MTELHFVVPDGIDDPARPSGGNVYDRRLSGYITAAGWSVCEHPVAGPWPQRDPVALAALAAAVERIPDGAAVLVDGLVASAAPEVLVPQAHRLRLVALVHMPLGDRSPEARPREAAVLASVASVVTTSEWSRRRLGELYELPAGRTHVAVPGADPADPAPGTAAGGEILCVGAVSFDKGHDVLVEALTAVEDLAWRCVCVGSLERAPVFAAEVGRRAAGLDRRLRFTGPRTGAELDRCYAAADLLVLPSRAETYGMVVTEALARGVPVIASDVGGVTEALGRGVDGIRPGLLVPPEEPAALGAALRAWLGDAELRTRLRRAAAERRESLPRWSATAAVVAGLLASI